MCAIDAFIFWLLLFLPMSHARLTFSFKHTCFFHLQLSFGGFGNFAIRLSSDPHLEHFLGVRYVCLFSKILDAIAFSFFCLIVLKKKQQSDLYLHKMCTFSEQCLLSQYFSQNLSYYQYLDHQSLRMRCSMIFYL